MGTKTVPRCHSLVSCRACSGATTDVSNGSADWLRWRARLSVSSTRRRCSSRRADQYRRPGHRPLGRVTAPPPPSAIPLVSFERRFSSTFRTGSPPSPPFRFCPPALERPLLASVRRRSEPPPPPTTVEVAPVCGSRVSPSRALCVGLVVRRRRRPVAVHFIGGFAPVSRFRGRVGVGAAWNSNRGRRPTQSLF